MLLPQFKQGILKMWALLLVVVIGIGLISCSGGGGGGEETGATNLISDAPVSIPAPIAKSIQPIDPRSIQEEEGLIKGIPSDSTKAQTIVAFLGGQFFDSTEYKPVVGEFSFPIEDRFDQPFAFCVLGSGSLEDIQSVSYPVIVTVGSTLQENGKRPVTVHVTNINATTKGEELAIDFNHVGGMDIVEDGGVGGVVLTSTNADGTPVIVFADIIPGPFEDFGAVFETGTEPLGSIQMTSDLTVIGITRGGESVFVLDSRAQLLTTQPAIISGEDYQSLSITPHEEKFVYPTRSSSSGSHIFKLFLTSDPESGTTVGTTNGTNNKMMADFLDNDTIVYMTEIEGEAPTNRIRLLDISSIVAIVGNSEALITPTEVGTTTASFSSLAADRVNQDNIIFGCRSALCKVNLNSGAVTELVDFGGDAKVKYIQFTEEANKVVFEIDLLGDDGDDGSTNRGDNTWTYWDVVNRSGGCQQTGTNPNPLKGDDSHIVAYLSELEDTVQLGIANLDNLTDCP